jgi:hypothetical protein
MAPVSKPDRSRLPPLRRSLLRTGLRLAGFVVFAYLLHLVLGWVMAQTEALPPGTGLAFRIAVFGGVLTAYAILIAVPFVPGIEIGISLILMRGAEVAPFVYLATVAGLMLAYFAGRLVPYRWLRKVFLDLRMARASAMLDRVQPLPPDQRLTLLRHSLPGRFGALAVDYRYLLLAGLINLPGSALIGGGGGICLLAGLTGLFSLRATLITISLAVLPLPLIFWFLGPGLLS